jgi:hypothetical protein
LRERQLARMRIEIHLIAQILDFVPPHMVPNQRDRHDQRHQPSAVFVDCGASSS